jgi:hypothetical protein
LTELNVRPRIDDSIGKVAHIQCVGTLQHGVHGDSFAVSQFEDRVVESGVLHANSMGADKVVGVVKREAFNIELGGRAGRMPNLNDTSALLRHWGEDVWMGYLAVVPRKWLCGGSQNPA